MIQKPPFCRNTSNFAVGHSGQMDFIQSNLIFFLVWMSQSIPAWWILYNVTVSCQLLFDLFCPRTQSSILQSGQCHLSSTCYWEETVGHCNTHLFKFIIIIIVRAEVFFFIVSSLKILCIHFRRLKTDERRKRRHKKLHRHLMSNYIRVNLHCSQRGKRVSHMCTQKSGQCPVLYKVFRF